MGRVAFLVVSTFITLLVSAGSLQATPITVISHSYSIYINGWYDVDPNLPHIVLDEYFNYSGNGAGPQVSHSTTFPVPVGSNEGDSGASFAKVFPFGLDLLGMTLEILNVSPSVTAEWIFTPNYDDLTVDVTTDMALGSGANFAWGGLEFELTDVTNGISLASFSHSELVSGGDLTIHYDDYSRIRLSTNNTYKMSLHGSLAGSDGLDLSSRVQFRTVPEPSTLLLLGMGLIGLAGSARSLVRR